MLTRKLCKEIHGKEVLAEIRGTSKKWNAVVLADMIHGVSIKPYFDKKEKKEFLQEYMETAKITKEEAIEMFDDPTFCFTHITKKTKINIIRAVVENGGFTGTDFSYGREPICPFA